MERLGWTNVGLKGIFDVLSTHPVLNGVRATIHSPYTWTFGTSTAYMLVIKGNDLHHAHVGQPGQLLHRRPFLMKHLPPILTLDLNSTTFLVC
jgi:hypothetical protein